MGIAPTRHIAAGRVDRDQLLAGPKPGRELGLEVADAVALALRKRANTLMREANIVLELRRYVLGGALDRRAPDQDLALVPIELPAIGAGAGFAVLLDLIEHARHGRARRRLIGRGRLRRLLEVA